MIFPGWTIARAIPYKYLAGLITGEFSLTGGVIRHAAGSAQAGQIVAHLLPASSSLLNLVPGLNFLPGLVANFQLQGISSQIKTVAEMTQINSYRLMQLSTQLNSLSQATQHVIQLATGTAILSGLTLAVGSLGFVVVNKKLNAIDEKLQTIRVSIQEIKEFLELGERAELRAALNDLLKVGEMNNASHRDKILNDRRQTLMKLNEKYKELLVHAKSIETIAANEEYFSLTGLAYSRCTAELGMFNMASQEIHELYTFWKEQARRAAKDRLIGSYPERFLASDFSSIVPVSALVSWLDFAYDERKGYEWIDDLRNKMDEPWYKKGIQKFTKGGGLSRSLGVGLHEEQTVIIPTLQKLLARNSVFEGYVSQYELLEKYELTPSEFDQKLAQLPEESVIDDCYILQLDSEKIA